MASVGIATFIRSVKGSVVVPIDLGGDTPKAVIVISTSHLTGNDAVAAGTDNAAKGPDFNVGYAVSPFGAGNAGQHRSEINDNSGTQVSRRRFSDSAVLFTGTVFSQDWEVYVTAFGADSVTLDFANAPISLGQDRRFTIIAFGGSDCQVHLNRQNMGTGTSPIDVTAPNFTPDVVFAATTYDTAVGNTYTGAAYMGLGVALNDGADTQRSWSRGEGAGTLTVSRPAQMLRDDCVAHAINASVTPATLGYTATIGTFDAQGYSITPSASWTSQIVEFLAIKAPSVQFFLDDFLTKNTTTGAVNNGGAPFAPNIALLVGGGSRTINTSSTWLAEDATSYVSAVKDATDPTLVGIHAVRNRNNTDPTESASFSEDNGRVITLGDSDFTGLVVGNFNGFSSDGFSVNYTTVDSVGHLFFALMMHTGVTTSESIDVLQSGALIVASMSAKVDVLQSGANIVAKQNADVVVSQSGVLAVSKVTPRPFNWVLPEIPITEEWKWSTDIITSDDGHEQRIALRSSPRISVTHQFGLDTAADLRRVFRAMWTELGKPIPVPHWAFTTTLAQVTEVGGTRLYFDPAKTNLRSGGYAFIAEPDLDVFQIVRVKTVLADGARLHDTLGIAFTTRANICPLTYNFPNAGTELKRSAPDTWGAGGYTAMDAATISPVTNAFAPVYTLPTCDGLPILHVRPIGDEFGQAVDTGASLVDLGPGKTAVSSPWARGQVVADRTFRVNRLVGNNDIEWFRTFAEYTRGSCFPFLAPSWRSDYDLAVPAVGAGTTLTLAGHEYLTYYWPHTGWRYIALETSLGLFVRRVDAAVVSGNNTVLTLQAALPVSLGTVIKVQQVALSRVSADTMSVVHYPLHTDVSFALHTIDDKGQDAVEDSTDFFSDEPGSFFYDDDGDVFKVQ